MAFDFGLAAVAKTRRSFAWLARLRRPSATAEGRTLDGLREVGEALALEPGHRLPDLACGGGAFGCWLTRRSGCGLVGVDFSSVAIEHA